MYIHVGARALDIASKFGVSPVRTKSSAGTSAFIRITVFTAPSTPTKTNNETTAPFDFPTFAHTTPPATAATMEVTNHTTIQVEVT